MVKILLSGYQDKRDYLFYEAISRDEELKVVGTVKNGDNLIKCIEKLKPQVVLNVSPLSYCLDNIKIIISYGISPIINSFNLSYKEINLLTKICKLKKLGCLIVPDFSISSNLLIKYSKLSYKYFKKNRYVYIDKKIFDNDKKNEKKIDYNLMKNKHIKKYFLYKNLLKKDNISFYGLSELLYIESISSGVHAFVPGIRFACKSVVKLRGLVYGLDNVI